MNLSKKKLICLNIYICKFQFLGSNCDGNQIILFELTLWYIKLIELWKMEIIHYFLHIREINSFGTRISSKNRTLLLWTFYRLLQVPAEASKIVKDTSKGEIGIASTIILAMIKWLFALVAKCSSTPKINVGDRKGIFFFLKKKSGERLSIKLYLYGIIWN